MKTNLLNLAQTSLRNFSIAAAALGMLSAATAKADLVFDNISNAENSVPGAAITGTGSTPNSFMGAGYVLAAGTTAITGFDLFPVNFTSTSYTGLRINIYVWGTVNTGTVNAAAPAFSNLLGNYTVDSSGSFAGGGTYFPYEGATVGASPGYTLATPLAISSTTIGLTFNYQGTTDGVNYANINALTSIISYGTAPTVGSQLFNGYYRNANSEVNGNFTSTLRSLGLTDQGLAVRVFGNVTPAPEPTTMALLGAGGVLLFLRRRRA